MELQNVPTSSIIGMVFSLIISIAVPVAICIYMRVKKKAKLSSFFIGCLTFFVVVFLVESIVNSLILGFTGTALTSNIWIYGLYGAFMAALFEETARFLVMKYFMKANLDGRNAVMYGAGHGGIEAILLAGLASLGNLAMSLMINNGALLQTLESLEDQSEVQETITGISTLWTTESSLFYLSGIERILAIVLQIALAVLVFMAIRTGKKVFLAMAYGIHFLVDFLIVVIANYISAMVAEGILLVAVAAIVYLVVTLYKKEIKSLDDSGEEEI